MNPSTSRRNPIRSEPEQAQVTSLLSVAVVDLETVQAANRSPVPPPARSRIVSLQDWIDLNA